MLLLKIQSLVIITQGLGNKMKGIITVTYIHMACHLSRGKNHVFIYTCRWTGFLSVKQLNPSICMIYRLQTTKKTANSNSVLHSSPYLQACALVRERRAKETCDNAHDCLGYITLQRGICMLPVTGVVAHLGKDRKDISMTHSHWVTLPACGQQVKHCMLSCHNHPNPRCYYKTG